MTAWIWSCVPTWVEVGDDIRLGSVQFERPVRSPRENAGPVAGFMGLINRKGFRQDRHRWLFCPLYVLGDTEGEITYTDPYDIS